MKKHYTILEQFIYAMKKKDNPKSVLSFLTSQNVKLFYKYRDEEDFPEFVKDEIIEFFLYFVENYDEDTFEARYANWGEADAPILQLGFEFCQERWDENKNEDAKDSDEFEGSADDLAERILNIPKNKTAYLIFYNVDGTFSRSFAKNIPDENWDKEKNAFMLGTKTLFDEYGECFMTVLMDNEDGTYDLFGVEADENGKLVSMNKDDLRKLMNNSNILDEDVFGDKIRFVELKR